MPDWRAILHSRGLRRLSAALAIAWMATIFWLSSQPDLQTPLDVPGSDKISHFVAFGLLATLLLVSFPIRGNRYSTRASITAVLLTMLYGVTDEWHQSFVPGRNPDIADIIADGVGALIAVLVINILVHRLLSGDVLPQRHR